jgi:hypothetical protein
MPICFARATQTTVVIEMKRRVMDLPDWPPEPAGSTPARGGTFATLPESVFVKELAPVHGTNVDFTAAFEDAPVRCFYTAPDEETARKLGKILQENVGNSLLRVGLATIPEG